MLIGGFPYVVDAVGYANTSPTRSAWSTTADRLLLGAAATGEYDLSPLWWKEAVFVGAARHSTDPGLDGAPSAHSIARAVEILDAGYLPPDAVSRTSSRSKHIATRSPPRATADMARSRSSFRPTL
jgi:hypothetical protein